MEKLLKYINNLSEPDRVKFAKKCHTTVGYLKKAVSTKQFLGAQTCVLIEKHTSGAVTRKELRPQDWRKIWPEI